jgi:TetR/AcrR family transcriptional repressor of mexJK operon
VLSLRRLIIAEADQFPDLAESYYALAPTRGIDVVAGNLKHYVRAGLLTVDNVRLAASHFAYLTLSPAQDRVLFMPTKLPSSRERSRLCRAAARAFVRAYR